MSTSRTLLFDRGFCDVEPEFYRKILEVKRNTHEQEGFGMKEGGDAQCQKYNRRKLIEFAVLLTAVSLCFH